MTFISFELIIIICCCVPADSNTKWINPHDMINFDKAKHGTVGEKVGRAIEPALEAAGVIEPAPQAASAIEPTPQAAGAIEPAPQADSVIEPAPRAGGVIEPSPQAGGAIEPVPQAAGATKPALQAAGAMKPALQAAGAMKPALQAAIPASDATCESDPTCESDTTCANNAQLLRDCQAARARTMTDGGGRADSGAASVYFQQYIRSMIRHLPQHSVMEGAVLQFDVRMQLSRDTMRQLHGFTAGGNEHSLQDMHTVLSDMIQHITPLDDHSRRPIHSRLWEACEQYLPIVLQVLFAVALGLVIVHLQLKLTVSVGWLLVMLLGWLFVISIGWTWVDLYLTEQVKVTAAAEKGRPDACSDTDVSYWATMRGYFTFKEADRCTAYYQQLLINPVWKVPPTKAVAITLVSFLLEPLELVGAASNRLFGALLTGIPIQYQPVLLSIFCAGAVLIVFVFAGYRASFFHVFTLERSPTMPASMPASVEQQLEQLMQQVHTLRQELHDCNRSRHVCKKLAANVKSSRPISGRPKCETLSALEAARSSRLPISDCPKCETLSALETVKSSQPTHTAGSCESLCASDGPTDDAVDVWSTSGTDEEGTVENLTALQQQAAGDH